MELIYRQNFTVSDNEVDRYGRLTPSKLLFFVQEVAGRHFDRLAMDYDALLEKNLFWAVIRHKVQITRLPRRGETVTVETWPMPTTRVAYPRSVIAYDSQGHECFRAISLWVLMDVESRAMVLPGKSGIEVPGTVRGDELSAPGSLPPKELSQSRQRTVCFTDLDRNGHMNNTRYLDWIDDLLPSAFHQDHPVAEFTVCYLSEAREGDPMQLEWDTLEDGALLVEGKRLSAADGDKPSRIFAAKLSF